VTRKRFLNLACEALPNKVAASAVRAGRGSGSDDWTSLERRARTPPVKCVPTGSPSWTKHSPSESPSNSREAGSDRANPARSSRARRLPCSPRIS